MDNEQSQMEVFGELQAILERTNLSWEKADTPLVVSAILDGAVLIAPLLKRWIELREESEAQLAETKALPPLTGEDIPEDVRRYV